MKSIKIFPEGSYVKGIEVISEIQYNLFVDVIPHSLNFDEINILLLSEPDIISGLSKALVNSHKNFDLILTHNQDILNKYSNAKLFVFNSIWVDANQKYEPKEFSISTVVGFKNWTKHHIMRHELWYLQEEIRNKKRFYIGAYGGPSDTFGNPILKDGKKEPMFMSQFHIVIENCSIDNFFTEKILDCFISKTVPVYCGCLNIDKFFDEKGIIKFSSIKECIDVCNNINEETYNKMLPYVEINYKKALDYLDWQKRIKDIIVNFKSNKTLFLNNIV